MDIDEEVRDEVRQSPVAFAEKVLDRDPYGYQEDFLESEERQKVFVAGRQVGKSTALSWYALWKFATRPNSDILFFAPSERQSRELFHSKLKAEIPEWVESPEAYGLEYITKSEIEGTNGSRMVALTAGGEKTKQTVRTYTADCIIVDEAAFIDDEFFTSVLAPMLLTTQGDFILAGTPWGKEGFFYNKYNDDRWFSQSISSYECPNIKAEDIEEWKEEMTHEEFKREVLGEFSEDQDAAIPSWAIKDCKHKGEGVYPEFSGEQCFLGVDPARFGNDRAFYVSVDGEGNVFDTYEVEKSSLSEVEGEIRRLDKERAYTTILIDETGLGGGPHDNLKKDKMNVEGMQFTLDSKQEIYQTLVKNLEEEELTLPNDRGLLKELHRLKRETTPRGKVKYHAPDDGHDDFADALALALWAREDGRTAGYMTDSYSFSSRGIR